MGDSMFCLAAFCVGDPSPTSTHLSDIELLLAAGDSITLGWALRGSPVNVIGASFSEGADDHVTTLPNIFKRFGVAVQGGSRGWVANNVFSRPSQCSGRESLVHCHLNAAMDGAKLKNLPGQIAYLNDTLLNQYGGMADKWKMLTLFVGLGDVFFGDAHNNPTPPSTFASQYENVLFMLQRWDRLFVNVILLPEHAYDIVDLLNSSKLCRSVYRALHSNMFHLNWTSPDTWKTSLEAYNRVIVGVVNEANVATRNRVVFSVRSNLKDLVLTYDDVEHFDCFHPDANLSALMAVNLWNEIVGCSDTFSYGAEPCNITDETLIQ